MGTADGGRKVFVVFWTDRESPGGAVIAAYLDRDNAQRELSRWSSLLDMGTEAVVFEVDLVDA